jgi:hypothetical protein
MSVPNSRNWKAVEEPNLEGGSYRVRVTGEVEAESPSLLARVPQGLDPRILMLDLSKVDDGPDYQAVEFRQASELHGYDHVDIFFLGQEVSRINVEEHAGPDRKRNKRRKPARKKAAKKKSAKKKTTKPAKKKMKKTANKRTAKKKSKKKSAKRATRKKRI